MGFNTYDVVGCCPNETFVLEAANAMVSTGLRALGYEYLVIDCGWISKDREPNGSITWNPELFPRGIPWLS